MRERERERERDNRSLEWKCGLWAGTGATVTVSSAKWQAQGKCLEELRQLSVRAPLEADDASIGPVFLKEVPFFDAELRSVYALRTLSAVLFAKGKAPVN